ncbi:DUF262 domain-containing protein [Halomonas elongata]|uniref:DUF262 domain-containing protein n=1 Tax=Halomonas elongata TaxID=2746 RepID=UPI00186B9BA1|nr:DUF262 domain-containing protein [Halomonas elongata]MBW5800976.1 DUF262 domain-containing protein [Halomonas elongata]
MTDYTEDKTLNLYPIDYPFETLVNRIQSKPPKLKLDPDFQRKYKWDKDGWVRSSRFIESCLMRIPLPSCYFAEDEDGRHMVIDGVQRLTTIARFFNDEFALEGMTTFKELEGKEFSELGALQTELETTTIRCIILRKENPKSLVREIFSRLNQGAVELSDQEIRHALYPGTLDELLVELAENPFIARFGLAEKSDVDRNSLESEEQVLRFFAFSDDPELTGFNANLKDFLDDYMERNSELDDEAIEAYRNSFNKALENCIEVFGDNVFTNPAAERKRKGLVHYDLLMPTVGRLDHNVAKEKKNDIKDAYLALCKSDDFKRTLSGGLQNRSSILRRKQSWSDLLEAAIDAG